MNLRIKVKQLQNGKWAAFKGKGYFVSTVRDTERESRIARLQEIGRQGQDLIDAADRGLDKLGALDSKDPHGYLA